MKIKPPHLMFFLFFIILLLPTACGTEVIASQATIPNPTTAKTKTKTMTSTPTSTNTWIPSSTPTIGPPPDLEIKNVTIYQKYGENFDTVGNTYYLLGRIRNNTDQTIVLYDESIVFKFTFEVWEFDSFYQKNYRHAIYLKEAKQRTGIDRIVNCILYPGDEGVLMYKTESLAKEYIIEEVFPQRDGPLGLWFSYKGNYSAEPDLRLDYHPKTENLAFEINKGELIFDYDLLVPNIKANYAILLSYIILFDNNGQIINILEKNVGELGGAALGKQFHIHGTTATPITDRPNYFRPKVDLNRKMIGQIDHIEVINEFVTGDAC